VDRHQSPTDRASLTREVLTATVTAVANGSGGGGDGFREGWISGLANTRLFLHRPRKEHPEINELVRYPLLKQEIAQLMEEIDHYELRQVMVNRLDAGGKLSAHRDGPPDDLRFHLPLLTNPDVMWWDEIGGTIHMEPGFWHGPVSYCGVLHAMVNNGDKPRLHVVADFVKS
jgi:hypothetical protein